MTQNSKNNIIIAAAGSGKTTHIVQKALSEPNKKILITTFTDKNVAEIKGRFYEIHGCIPNNVEILPWFTFLLSNCVRPYQLKAYKNRIDSIHLINGQSAKFIARNNVAKYYFDNSGRIYSDKIAEFSFRCNEESKGMVLYRLSLIYQAIYIDEVQDLSGWDLELLNELFKSNIEILCVGDPRQGTLRTNNAQKNRNKSQTNLLSYFRAIERKYSLDIDDFTLNINHRSVAEICDFSNKLFCSELWTATTSDFIPTNIEHLGVFFVKDTDIVKYLKKYNPIQLRNNITTKTNANYKAINIRLSKGATYERTLIYPTGKMLDWMFNSNLQLAPGTRCAFYVAVTRARYSVAIVIDDKHLKKCSDIPIWEPPVD